MFIEFTAIRLQNLLSYGKTPTEIILNSSPTTLFLGENGSGKSSIPNILSFVLFKDTFRGIQEHQLVNSENAKNAMGEVDFRIGSDKYTIRRGLKPSKLEVIKNGNALSQDSGVQHLQSKIENEILQMDKKTFSQIVSLAEVNFTPFLQLPAGARRLFVEKALGLEIFSTMNSILKVRVKDTQTLCDSLQSQINTIDEKVQIHRQYIEKAKQENKEKVAELREQIKDLQDKKQIYITELESTQAQLEPFMEEASQFQELNQKALQVKVKLAKVETTLRNEEARKHSIKSESICPTCEQPLPKKVVQSKIAQIDANIAALTEELKKGNKIRESVEKEISEFQNNDEEITRLRAIELEQNVNLRSCADQIKMLEKEIPKYSVSKSANIKDILNEISELEQNKEKLEQQLSELWNNREIQDVSLQLLKDDGVKAEIIRKYIPKINQYINGYLEEMNFNTGFYLNHEFEEEIRARGKEIFSYNSFSAGQRQRIDLALLFTWRALAKSRNSVNTNLLFMDEVLDSHLNLQSAEMVSDCLSGPLFKGTNVFVISQKPDLAPKFHRIVNFELVNGYTRVTQ